jgi:hypothetical protein
MVNLGEASVFIIDIVEDIITFRSSRIPERLQKLKIEAVENDMAYFGPYFCHVNYLNKFLTENELITDNQ